MIVWVLIIGSRKEDRISVHETEESANKTLAEYVKENWSDGDCPEVVGEDEIFAHFDTNSWDQSYLLDSYAVLK